MKVPSYTQTTGLDRYPQDERFGVYRAAHKRLLSGDASYRRRWTSYMTAVVCLAFIPIFGWAAIIYLVFRQQEFQNQRIGDVLRAAP